MNTDQRLTLARQYLDLSNAHDLDHIFPMFDKDATYHSSQYGGQEGIARIQEMMKGFFTRFPDVNWQVDTYTPEGDNGVVFLFAMQGTNQESGEKVERHGRETIQFNDDGLITHIEVEALSQEPPSN